MYNGASFRLKSVKRSINGSTENPVPSSQTIGVNEYELEELLHSMAQKLSPVQDGASAQNREGEIRKASSETQSLVTDTSVEHAMGHLFQFLEANEKLKKAKYQEAEEIESEKSKVRTLPTVSKKAVDPRLQFLLATANAKGLTKDEIRQYDLSAKLNNRSLPENCLHAMKCLWVDIRLGRYLVDGSTQKWVMKDLKTWTKTGSGINNGDANSYDNDIQTAPLGWVAALWPLFLVVWLIIYLPITIFQMCFLGPPNFLSKNNMKTNPIRNSYYQPLSVEELNAKDRENDPVNDRVNEFFTRIRALMNHRCPMVNIYEVCPKCGVQGGGRAAEFPPKCPTKLKFVPDTDNRDLNWNISQDDFKSFYKLKKKEKDEALKEINLIQTIAKNSENLRFNQIKDRWAMLGDSNSGKHLTTYHMLVHDDTIFDILKDLCQTQGSIPTPAANGWTILNKLIDLCQIKRSNTSPANDGKHTYPSSPFYCRPNQFCRYRIR